MAPPLFCLVDSEIQLPSPPASVSVGNPTIALGIYNTTSSSSTVGYSVIFNDQGKGFIYRATGNAYTGNLTFEIPTEVKMGPFNLTTSAVPVSMMGTGYLLDKARAHCPLLRSLLHVTTVKSIEAGKSTNT